ncbi:reverse transcriptase (RNA-dependent DNA polymerase) domain-containing protein [Phthorimaea operculella]|nr:reverse transcriptase (RNA-dependent DNA polymerase) domain-containing protein [Phthorimaea operculella]
MNKGKTITFCKFGCNRITVLGPLHYLAYVNDINNIIRYCTVYQYADDTCLISAANDLHIASKNLQCDFDNVCRWSHDAGLVLNADKTKLLHISSSHNISGEKLAIIAHTHLCLHVNSNYNVTYTCSCPSLEEVSSQKYLGLIIDNRFNWGVHIEHVCNKLRAVLAKFYVINNRIPFSVKLAMYNALAESVISYGLSSYGRTFDTYLNEIYKLQVRILKLIVPHKIKNILCTESEIFSFCGVLPIKLKFRLSILKEQFFNDKILRPITVNRSTRYNTNNIILYKPRSNNFYGKRISEYIVPDLMNKLPLDVKNKITPQNCAKILKQEITYLDF